MVPVRIFLLAALIFLGCDEEDKEPGPGPTPFAKCAELSDSLFPDTLRNGLAQFKVVTPNGGSSFKVGQEMRVVVGGADYTSALVDLVVFGANGGAARVPGFPATNGIKPHEKCEWRFAVPESVTTVQNKRIALVSDSVKVKITDYSDGESFDYSDAFFSVSR